jgi:hypothetical protein
MSKLINWAEPPEKFQKSGMHEGEGQVNEGEREGKYGRKGEPSGGPPEDSPGSGQANGQR